MRGVERCVYGRRFRLCRVKGGLVKPINNRWVMEPIGRVLPSFLPFGSCLCRGVRYDVHAPDCRLAAGKRPSPGLAYRFAKYGPSISDTAEPRHPYGGLYRLNGGRANKENRAFLLARGRRAKSDLILLRRNGMGVTFV